MVIPGSVCYRQEWPSVTVPVCEHGEVYSSAGLPWQWCGGSRSIYCRVRPVQSELVLWVVSLLAGEPWAALITLPHPIHTLQLW